MKPTCTQFSSEKPPHHMGIKTYRPYYSLQPTLSEKPPHHMGIKTVQFFWCRISDFL